MMLNRYGASHHLGTVVLVLCIASASLSAQSNQADRVRESTVVFEEIMSAADSAIPASVLDKAEAIAVFPSTLRAGFLIGAQRGRGIISVRNRTTGEWSPPAFLTLTGGSIGAQIGGESVDIVLIVMNRRGLEHLLQNQFKIGAEASVSAGPVGRNAEMSTDIQLRAQILSYSRSRGLFAGITLQGSAIRQDRDSNEEFYGRRFRTREIVLDRKATAPQSPDAVAEWARWPRSTRLLLSADGPGGWHRRCIGCYQRSGPSRRNDDGADRSRRVYLVETPLWM